MSRLNEGTWDVATVICSSWSLLAPDRIFTRLTGTPSPTKRDWCRRARRVLTRMDLLVPSLCTLWAMNERSVVKVRNVWDSTAISGDPGLPATHTAEQLILVVSGGRLDYVWKRQLRNSPCICLVMLKVKAATWEARWLSHVFYSITWQQVSNIYQASSSIVSSVHSSKGSSDRSIRLRWIGKCVEL